MFFPVFIDLKDKPVLVIGAGKVAFNKIKKVLEYGAKITVISEKIIEKEILNLKNLEIINKKILLNSQTEKILKNYFLVICATDDKNLNKEIAKTCFKNNILVNNVSSKTEMNTRFGAIVKNDEFQIAISTNGKSCKRSRAMKSEIKKVLDKIEN